jgi:peptidoglycan/xylan/chitin deacetylase (PgdA/CDA1 family)
MSVLRRPIPDKLVVLTFDDGSISQLRVAGPLLRELGFGATFFLTEGLKIPEDRMLPADERTFMTWEEVRELHTLGGGASRSQIIPSTIAVCRRSATRS